MLKPKQLLTDSPSYIGEGGNVNYGKSPYEAPLAARMSCFKGSQKISNKQ